MKLLNLNLQVIYFPFREFEMKSLLETYDVQYKERKKSKNLIQQEGDQECTGFSLKCEYEKYI